MLHKKLKNKKFEITIILLATILSLFLASYNLNKFDKIKINFDGRYYNQLLYADLGATWHIAEKFRKNLKEKKNFFDSVPEYRRFLLPSIIVGYYYYLIDKEIFEKKENNQIVIKEKNYKFGLLIIQILIYYLSLFFFSCELKKIVKNNLSKYIIIFLALEPSLLQWHSSFWSESLFLSFMIIIFTLILKASNKLIINLFVGFILGLMFIQRGVSFLYIIPIIIYLFFVTKNKLKTFSSLLIGYLMILIFVGVNNLKKTDHFFLLALHHQYYSYYHYFAADLLGDRKKISEKKASNILSTEEEQWVKENNINIENSKDLSKNITYRNKIFLREVLKNPIYFLKKISKKIITMCIIQPFWVNSHFYFDKTDPNAIENPKEYYNKKIFKNIPYSIFIYIFSFVGILKLFKKIVFKRKLNGFDKFLILNFLSIFYFIAISGLWGNPKYFTPCMISISFFFSSGFMQFQEKFIKKNN